LKSLEVFNCSGNNLSYIPSLSKLTALKNFDATQNNLVEFPVLPIPASKGSLTHLYLGYNRIPNIPFAALAPHQITLTEFLIHNNLLREVPAELEYLVALKVLDLSNNDLKDLPATLGWVETLQHLKVDGNSIKTIRQALLTKPAAELKAFLRTRGPSLRGAADSSSSFSSTATGGKQAGGSAVDPQLLFRIRDMGSVSGLLDLSRLKLTNLSADLAEVVLTMPSSSSLAAMDVSSNKFNYLPLDMLQHLPMVRSLVATDNQLGDGQGLVSADGSPQNSGLTALDMSNNKLSSYLLSELLSNGNLVQLRDLCVSCNPLKAVDPLLNQLSQLRVLRLGFCGLVGSIDPLDVSNMPHLQTLDLSNNKLVTLGDSSASIFRAQQLEFLSLENNCMNEIPPQLALLPRLVTLLIVGNPQRAVRPQVVQQGSAKVLELLRSRLGLSEPPPANPTTMASSSRYGKVPNNNRI